MLSKGSDEDCLSDCWMLNMGSTELTENGNHGRG